MSNNTIHPYQLFPNNLDYGLWYYWQVRTENYEISAYRVCFASTTFIQCLGFTNKLIVPKTKREECVVVKSNNYSTLTFFILSSIVRIHLILFIWQFVRIVIDKLY